MGRSEWCFRRLLLRPGRSLLSRRWEGFFRCHCDVRLSDERHQFSILSNVYENAWRCPALLASVCRIRICVVPTARVSRCGDVNGGWFVHLMIHKAQTVRKRYSSHEELGYCCLVAIDFFHGTQRCLVVETLECSLSYQYLSRNVHWRG